MLRVVLGLVCLSVLAGCGADGPPVAPGLTMGGSVSMGIAKNGG